MTDWPLTLPQQLQVGDFDDAAPDNLMLSEMDQGPPKSRRKSTSNAAPMSGSMVMTTAQWAALLDFYLDTIMEALPFNFPDPDDNEETLAVKFTRAPTRRPAAPGKWRVRLEFIKLP